MAWPSLIIGSCFWYKAIPGRQTTTVTFHLPCIYDDDDLDAYLGVHLVVARMSKSVHYP